MEYQAPLPEAPPISKETKEFAELSNKFFVGMFLFHAAVVIGSLPYAASTDVNYSCGARWIVSHACYTLVLMIIGVAVTNLPLIELFVGRRSSSFKAAILKWPPDAWDNLRLVAFAANILLLASISAAEIVLMLNIGRVTACSKPAEPDPITFGRPALRSIGPP